MVKTKTKTHASFAAGAVLLAISALVVKLIGVCYKIPLVHLLGAQGMGYFNAAYDVYALLCVISTTGLPVAVSVVGSRYPRAQRRAYLLSLAVFAFLGMLGAASVFIFADRIALWIGAQETAQSLRFIAPAVLFICLSGAFRGYYQAKRNMTPTAVSQVIEAAGKLLFGLLFAHIAIRLGKGTATVSAFAVLGLSIGTLLCLIYLVLCNKSECNMKQHNELSSKLLIKEIMIVAFPVTLGAVLTGLSKVIDLSLIMRRLQDSGIEQGAAVTMYGCYTSMVVPLFNVVPALFTSIAMPLTPHLGHAITNKDHIGQRYILNTAFRWGIAISIPASLGMAMISKQILELLFNDAQEVQTAVPLLIIISIAIPASCMITATSAVLQAYGRAWQPMISTALGCIVKITVLYILCGMPAVGILAAPISTLVCCTVTAIINLYFVAKAAPAFDFANHVVYALAASALAIGIAAIVQRLLPAHIMMSAINVGIIIITAILLYLPVVFLCGLVRISDFKSIISNKEKDT